MFTTLLSRVFLGSYDNQKSNGMGGQVLLCTGSAAEETECKEKSQMMEGSWEGFVEKAALELGIDV